MNIDYVNFYNNFVKLCKEKGLKPSRAGIEAGIPKQTVSNWKAGRKPSDTYIAQLADYFGVPVEYFSEETEKQPTVSDGLSANSIIIEAWNEADEAERKLMEDLAKMIRLKHGGKNR